ncbi:MAG: PAS domain-containing sensor histidine kinase [Ignavibacteriaceae bacterium]
MNKKIKFDFDLFEKFQDMCFVVAANGETLYLNKIVYDSLKLTTKNLINQNFFDLIEPAFVGRAKLILTNCIKEKKNESLFTKFNVNGKTYDVNLFLTPFSDSSGNTDDINCFILARDVTDQRLKEIELMRFYYVAQNTVNPVQITDLQGKMIYVNPAFVETSGYSREDLIGKNPSIFSSGKHSKKFWAKMWTTISAGKVWAGEVENRKKNGDPFYTQLLISPILDSDGNVTGFFGIHRDLAEKKLLEKQLIHTQKMESIGTLAAGVAHEVGNPLASISALVQVVQRSTNDEFAKEKLELIKKQVTRISKIIRDLVDFSRPSNYELQLTDVNQNIAEAIEIIKVGAKAKDIVFNLDLNKKIPLLPLISDQIQQIFVNILLNAVDAISELEDNRKQKKIEVNSDIIDDFVILVFSDNGKGIPEENLAKVFEPFFTTKKAGKGTGLGLWVSYGIIKSFQGDIKVESKLNQGTTFTITLPIQP